MGWCWSAGCWECFEPGEDVYRRSVTASYADLVRGPGALTERLIAPLLRALRTRERYGSVFADPSVAATPAS